MAKAVYKFPLYNSYTGHDAVAVEMQVGANVLCAQIQLGTICLWAIVEEEHAKETRIFEVFGTGIEFPEDIYYRQYIGTVQIGKYVWHIFERLDE